MLYDYNYKIIYLYIFIIYLYLCKFIYNYIYLYATKSYLQHTICLIFHIKCQKLYTIKFMLLSGSELNIYVVFENEAILITNDVCKIAIK